jgi:uncharacterized protein YndB with AHSA1/START domain
MHENQPSFTTAFTVPATPEQVFDAIMDVRGWWSGDITGDTTQLGDVFTYRYQDLHRTTQRLTEVIPNRRVVWEISDSHLSFVADSAEWDGTRVVFEITPTAVGTEVRFTHVGLEPEVECYDSCSNAWSFYITTSLRDRIVTGSGAPNAPAATTPV